MDQHDEAEHPDGLTHLDGRGQARMVDVGAKAPTERVARARAVLRMKPETYAMLIAGDAPKGDVLATARIAGIQAAKRVPELIPLCHHVAITGVTVTFEPRKDGERLDLEARVACLDRTGVEMEALTAVTVAALTVYDMLKAVDRGMVIEEARLVEKSGGRSGHFQA